MLVLFFQAEDGIRDLVRSRGLGDVYKRQGKMRALAYAIKEATGEIILTTDADCEVKPLWAKTICCLLYTSDAADERSSVDLGGRRIIKKKKKQEQRRIAR